MAADEPVVTDRFDLIEHHETRTLSENDPRMKWQASISPGHRGNNGQSVGQTACELGADDDARPPTCLFAADLGIKVCPP